MMTDVLHTAAQPQSSLVRTPWWGTPADRRAAARALLYASALTGLYVLVAVGTSNPTPSRLEVFATITSLACVWISRKQNVLCMPLGLLGVFATAAFFFQVGLLGQAWLNVAYYLPVQVLGWRMWIRPRASLTDRPVSWMTPRVRAAVISRIGTGTVVLVVIFSVLHGWSDTLVWDCSIVAASIAAQWLLTTKHIEAWWLWLIPVDVSAILLYAVSGAHLFSALYIVYLVLASLGLRNWMSAWDAQSEGLDPAVARLQ